MVETLSFQCGVMGSVPGWGSKISHAMKYGQKKFFLIKKKKIKTFSALFP